MRGWSSPSSRDCARSMSRWQPPWPSARRCGRRVQRSLKGDLVSYTVKEIFLTLQGEGAHAGRAAVFCRFAGCTLWSGREQDRATATCRFCDTDFVGTDGTLGGRYLSADELADTIAAQWVGATERFAVLTGGEPLLQLDTALLDALHARS